MQQAEASSVRSPDRRGRIDDIEVLRAFAVGMVLLQHAAWNLIPWVFVWDNPLYHYFSFWSGVDLFFAISGFVIARSLLPMLAETRGRAEYVNTTLSFWVRRGWRLLPTAWLWLVVMLILATAFNSSGAFGPLRSNVTGAIAAALNLENIRLAQTFGHEKPGVTTIYWTLSLEEQFYIALPFVIFFASRRLPLVLAAIVLAQLFADRSSLGGLLLNLTRSDALALGVLLAIWSGHPSYRVAEPTWLGRGPWRVLLAPAFLLAFGAATGPALGLGRFTLGVLALMAAAIVWVASYGRDYIVPPGRFKQIMCWMGARSYAIYLIHLPVFHATVEFWWRANPNVLKASPWHLAILLACALPLTLALAELNFRLIEDPLRRRGARIAEGFRRRHLGAIPVAAGEAA